MSLCLHALLPMQFEKTRSATHARCCACQGKNITHTSKVCWPCPAKCNASSENQARVLRAIWFSRTHENSAFPTSTARFHYVKASQNDTCCSTSYMGTAIATSQERLRAVANGGDRLLTAAQLPNPQSEKGTFAKHSGIIGVKKNDWVSQILHAIVELKLLNLYILIGV